MTYPLLFLAVVVANEPADTTLRYLRSMGDGFALESTISLTKTAGGHTYASATERPKTKLTLRLELDANLRPVSGQIVQVSGGATRARLTIAGRKTVVRRHDDTIQELTAEKEIAIATSAPDWSDIFLLLRHYDHAKGGRQDFQGVWFHPLQAARLLTFEVERIGTDEIVVDGKRRELSRCRVRLRSGEYVVWADRAGLVYKLMPPGRPQNAVILEGFEKSGVRALGTTRLSAPMKPSAARIASPLAWHMDCTIDPIS